MILQNFQLQIAPFQIYDLKRKLFSESDAADSAMLREAHQSPFLTNFVLMQSESLERPSNIAISNQRNTDFSNQLCARIPLTLPKQVHHTPPQITKIITLMRRVR